MAEISEKQIERLSFPGSLALLLNSSLDTRRVISVALKHLQRILEAEAVTVFSLDQGAKEISFWALQGGESDLLNRRIPFGKGVVGWVIENRRTVHVKDAASDPRFFGAVDQEGTFKTREMICTPLIVKGEKILGALQVLNPVGGGSFDEEDIPFVEQCSQQLSLALENARLYESLKEQHLRLEALDRRKGELVSIISHEFRTPLNIIRTASELLVSSDGIAGDLAQEVSSALFNGVDRLTRAVTAITNLSMVQREEMSLELTDIPAACLIDEVVKQLGPAASDRRIDLKSDTGRCAACVRADRGLLAIVLSNLVANAIRFTPDGGCVSVAADPVTGMVEFSVADNGIGIPEAEIPLIFEKFYEVVSADYHSSGNYGFKSCGLGLGLPTASSILAAHGSKIRVESEVNKGSRFSFVLPAVS